MLTYKQFLAFLAVGFLVFSCSESSEVISDQEELSKDVVPGQYIVVFDEGAISTGRASEPQFVDRGEKMRYTASRIAQVNNQIDGFLEEGILDAGQVQGRYTSIFAGFTATLSNDEVSRLESDPRVAIVEQDRMITLDVEVEQVFTAEEFEKDRPGGRTQAQTTTCAINNAGGFTNGAGSNTFLWIVDTGIDLDHPDLNVNTQFSRAFRDGNPDDSNGHGTHVAGIAAAVNNSIGVVGVSAGAQVVAIDVLGSGSAPTSTIINGMDFIAANDIAGDVVNMSLGPRNRTGCSSGSSYRLALERLNDQSRVALAAGNSADNAAFYDPACQNLTGVYTVASMTCSGAFSSFSNFGTPPVDWIATGSSVTSTYRGGRYATLSGTSMASPVVAGILHSRNSAPVQCGSVSYRGQSYRIACR
ncbi:MAG: S8 family serine peptidase [Cytophagales bacterium]|nr:S8 family serine peptidase [Cytophagales bacterium]